MQYSFLIISLSVAGILTAAGGRAGAEPPASPFIGEVIARWVKNDGADKDMVLMEDFAFVDPKGVRWEAKKGEVINGASIPPFLWSQWVGTPFTGDYRRASVLHDAACDAKTRRWQDVHRMFLDAMLADGNSRTDSWVKYAAVYSFGPRWPDPTIKANDMTKKLWNAGTPSLLGAGIDKLDELGANEFRALIEIERQNPPRKSPEEVEKIMQMIQSKAEQMTDQDMQSLIEQGVPAPAAGQ